MAHPVLWRGQTFFYPIGNTSAVCLTQDLCPEEAANILLLGCGDPRHILYTVYASALDSHSSNRKLDVTCCDVEGAVIARNLILFTLLADKDAAEKLPLIWNIFYQLYLDKDSLSLLTAQCQKLIGFTRSVEIWRNCPYAAFAYACTEETLVELQQFLALYVEVESFPHEKQARFKREYVTGLNNVREKTKGKYTTASSRSAGPVFVDSMPVVSNHFERFWSTGCSLQTSQTFTLPNPTFAYSMAGKKFAVHYGVDPLASFHLAEIFAPIQNSTQKKGQVQKITVDTAVAAAQNQFYRWCTATSQLLYRNQSSSSSFKLRFFIGDALSFCCALRASQVITEQALPLHTAPWKASFICLDNQEYGPSMESPAPTMFNVIETSNILDHVGLLNVLTCTSPLLISSPSSTLYTEGLLPAGDNPLAGILEHICGDLPVISLLIGLVPIGFVSRFTTQSNMHDVLSHAINGSEMSQFHDRLAWKSTMTAMPLGPESDAKQTISLSSDQLVNVLFDVYTKMFASENITNKFAQLQARDTRALHGTSIIHYMRRSFAEFIRTVMCRIETDWSKVMEPFCDMVTMDRNLLTGMNNYQDLCLQFHRLGVYTVEWLLPKKIQELRLGEVPKIFRGWKNIPQTICVVLSVPRNRLALYESLLDEIGTPTLHCDVDGAMSHNVFSSISVVFGKLQISGEGDGKKVSIEEDKTGRFGTSNLIVSCWLPAATFFMEPLMSIGLGIHSTPATSFALMAKLGPKLRLFDAKVEDTRFVHALAGHPTPSRDCPQLTATSEKTTPPKIGASTTAVCMNSSGTKISTFTVHLNVVDPIAQSLLTGGSTVHVAQVSPMSMHLCLDSYKQLVLFPLPVDATRAKLRVARKSKYIEIIAPPLLSNVVKGPNTLLGVFPVIIKDRDAMLWNMHRTNLDRLPVLDATNPKKLDSWFGPHVGLMMSDRERALRETGQQNSQMAEDAFVNLKDSLHTIFIHAAGLQGTKPRTAFGLADPSTVGCYTLIFVTNLRLDLGCHTIIADSWVVPLTHALVDKLGPALAQLAPQLLQVKTNMDEIRAWKQLLPAVTERCRSWRHKESCEYIAKGIIPLSTEYTEDPICTCGRGLGSRAALPKEFQAFAPFATRAALSPLFAVSYLENVIGTELSGKLATGKQPQVRPPVCGVCGKEGKQLACSKCHNVRYCSPDCQRKDWKTHKMACT
ncbi:hypothetical protein BJ138DRAFT_1094271 [Hygrophoropsis aurantiaca]|uniref:Uncharacterized protein n=1 Tax=Hygrophoropsis aurantiaca TaxID=72124 RepID=A0ACB7ZZX8_9AGAM|nr:hypothetical protein BJ138DRAFT_1094271 [Hygrophoropsis aurantiaca]